MRSKRHLSTALASANPARAALPNLAGLISRLIAVWMAACLVLAVTGCANNAEYPNLGRITDMGTVLTPEEQKKTIEDAQKQSGTDGAKTKK